MICLVNPTWFREWGPAGSQVSYIGCWNLGASSQIYPFSFILYGDIVDAPNGEWLWIAVWSLKRYISISTASSAKYMYQWIYKMTTIEFHVYFPSFKTWLHWVVGLSTFCETGACWCRTSWNTYIAMVVDLDSLVKMLLTKGAPKAPKGFGVCVEELNFSDWHDVYRPNEFRILSGKAYIRINSVRFRPPVLFAMHWQTFILVIVLVHFSKNLPPLSEAYESSNWFWKVHGEPYMYIYRDPFLTAVFYTWSLLKMFYRMIETI